MKNSSFYSRLASKNSIYDRGFKTYLKQFTKVDYSQHEVSRSLGLYTFSDLKRLFKQPYRKVLHVNGKNAALIFKIQDSSKQWIPWTGSKYYSLNENCPDLIVRHIRFHKYLGEVKVVKIDGNWLTVETFEGTKIVMRNVFVKGAVDSINEWVGKKELERLRFIDRMHPDNDYRDVEINPVN